MFEEMPMTLSIVRLDLPCDKDCPEGSSANGYEFVLPLTAQGHIDTEAWRKHRERCRVRRFWDGEADEQGHVVHRPGGTWVFHYDLQGDPDEDEPGYKFDTHVFRPGEYVSLREQDGEMRTFRIVSVKPAP